MSTDEQGSISRWLIVLKANDDHAAVDGVAKALWNRYFDRLVRMARARMRYAPGALSDEEDVALSAIKSFCRRAADGKFPRLDDRHDLWRILSTIAARKAASLYRHPHLGTLNDSDLDQVIGKEPTPEFAATVADELRRLLNELPKESYRTIAWKKLEGYTNDEIAESLGCSTKNVEYKLRNIRAIWLPYISEEPPAELPS